MPDDLYRPVALRVNHFHLNLYSFMIYGFYSSQCRQAASSRQLANKSNSPNHVHTVQGGMTEDEALAHALARSIQELDEAHDRNRRNQQQQHSVPCGGTSTNGTSKDKCSLS